MNEWKDVWEDRMNLHDNILAFNKHHLSHTSIFYDKLKGVFAKKKKGELGWILIKLGFNCY